MSDNASKQKQLVDGIAAAVRATLDGEFQALRNEFSAEFANIASTLATIMARLEVLDIAGGVGAPKRAPRGEKKPGGAAAPRAAAAEAAGEEDPWDKVKNAMLYCRRKWATDPDFRSRYLTANTQQVFDADDAINKKQAGSEDRLLLEGSVAWKKCLSEPQKKEVRDDFTRWKEARERGELADSLTADDVDDKAVDDVDDKADDDGPA